MEENVVVEQKYTGPGVDYSSKGSSDFMDIYLHAHCLFSIMYDSGIDFIPTGIFSKPHIVITPAFAMAHYGDGHIDVWR